MLLQSFITVPSAFGVQKRKERKKKERKELLYILDHLFGRADSDSRTPSERGLVSVPQRNVRTEKRKKTRAIDENKHPVVAGDPERTAKKKRK